MGWGSSPCRAAKAAGGLEGVGPGLAQQLGQHPLQLQRLLRQLGLDLLLAAFVLLEAVQELLQARLVQLQAGLGLDGPLLVLGLALHGRH